VCSVRAVAATAATAPAVASRLLPRQGKRTRGTHVRPHAEKAHGTAGTTIRRRDTASLSLVARDGAIRPLSLFLSLSLSPSPRRLRRYDRRERQGRQEESERGREGGRDGRRESETDMYTRIKFSRRTWRVSRVKHDDCPTSLRLVSSTRIGSESLYSVDMTTMTTTATEAKERRQRRVVKIDRFRQLASSRIGSPTSRAIVEGMTIGAPRRKFYSADPSVTPYVSSRLFQLRLGSCRS